MVVVGDQVNKIDLRAFDEPYSLNEGSVGHTYEGNTCRRHWVHKSNGMHALVCTMFSELVSYVAATQNTNDAARSINMATFLEALPVGLDITFKGFRRRG